MSLQFCAGLAKYTSVFVWELAVNFNGHSHAKEKTREAVPNAHGTLTLMILESLR